MFIETFKITLCADVAITADAATEGGHNALDYLPGSVFLGAVVARSLRNGNDFDPSRFLSGRIRFSNAYPEVQSNPSFPVPFAFYITKGKSWEDQVPHSLLASADDDKSPVSQKEQLRSGFLTSNGAFFIPALNSRLKTAIDRETGRAKDEQLFDRQSIPAGTTFILYVQADSEEDLAFAGELLTEKKLRLGKSRSAEYGQAVAKRIKDPKPASAPERTNGKIHLYLLSDLCLLRDGTPILYPKPADFGLPDNYECDPGRTIIRTRRFSPWNTFFKCRMSERQVLCKGSVLTFRPRDKNIIDFVELQKRLAPGIGLYREEGFGQLLVNPSWLLNPPALRKPGNLSAKGEATKPESSSLITYLVNKQKEQKVAEKVFKTAIQWAKEWHRLTKKLQHDKKPTPGKSQWSNIRTIATQCLSRPDCLVSELESFCNESLRRKHWSNRPQRESLHVAITEKLGANPDQSKCLTLRLASIEMVRLLQTQKKENSR